MLQTIPCTFQAPIIRIPATFVAPAYTPKFQVPHFNLSNIVALVYVPRTRAQVKPLVPRLKPLPGVPVRHYSTSGEELRRATKNFILDYYHGWKYAHLLPDEIESELEQLLKLNPNMDLILLRKQSISKHEQSTEYGGIFLMLSIITGAVSLLCALLEISITWPVLAFAYVACKAYNYNNELDQLYQLILELEHKLKQSGHEFESYAKASTKSNYDVKKADSKM